MPVIPFNVNVKDRLTSLQITVIIIWQNIEGLTYWCMYPLTI